MASVVVILWIEVDMSGVGEDLGANKAGKVGGDGESIPS